MIEQYVPLSGPYRWSCIVLVALGLLYSPELTAQFDEVAGGSKDRRHRQGIGIGLSTGTNAILGADVTFDLIPKVNFRLAYHRLKFDITSISIETDEYGWDDQVVLADLSSDLSSIALLADYGLNRRENLRVIAGLYVGLDNNITLSGEADRSIQFNDYEIPAEDVGSLSVAYSSELPLFPYLGIGIGRSVPFRRFNASLELGAFYRGAPKIEVFGTGLLAGNDINGPILSEKLTDYRFHPSVALRVSYRIDVGRKKVQRENSLLNEFLEGLPDGQVLPQDTTFEAPTPVPAPSTAEAPRTIPVSYQTFQGFAVDRESGRPIDFFNMDVRRIKPDGSKELVRTGRYQYGRFSLSLQTGITYEFSLVRRGYERLRAQVLHSGEAITEYTFKLVPVSDD